MYSLFSTSSSVAGFRLQYMEIFNWGTFHNKVYPIRPQGNNSLLTGANESGKSTLVDALLTLLVPTKKDRFYNQSSGLVKKGDRTEETYVLGNYGTRQKEGETGTTAQRLRDKKTYSVIIASFYNTDQRIITLFQVRWFVNDELKTTFGLSREPLEIQKDFSNFDSKGTWKKLLDKKYNQNTTKKRIEFFNGPTDYGERIWNLFGMRSYTGLTLFNQIVGVKVLGDLDEFISNNMLEGKDSENEYIQLKENFQTLIEAKINIDKTKEQIAQLQPIDEIAKKLVEIQDKLEKLQQSKEIAVYWFAKKKVELAETELEKCKENLEKLKEELQELKDQETDLKNHETDLTVQIKTDAVGNQIEKLKTEIRGLETSRDNRKKKLYDYNKIAQKVEFSENPTEKTFTENREKARNKKDELESLVTEKNEELRLAKNKSDDIKKDIDAKIETIQLLQKTKNNISGREAEIREMILNAVDATTEEIPFIGELMRVKDNEKEWELSIEKILHNFALRLIVPEKYYTKVNQFVNSNNLKGRIVYQRYRDFTSLKEFTNRDIASNSLFHKIEFKPKNVYTDWLEDAIFNNYNYACVNDLQEFNRYEERTVTKEGLIKSIKGKHEKDDRPHILRKENYVLGWDNKEKIRLIQAEIRTLQSEQQDNTKQIRLIEKSIKDTNALEEDFSDLFKLYTKYDDIDWQSYAKTIQEKTEEKKKLEETNDKIKALDEQLKKVQTDLKTLTEVDITDKNKAIFQLEEVDIKNVNRIFSKNSNLLQQLGEIDTANFEQENPDLITVSYENIETKQTDFQDKNRKETEKQKGQKSKNESEVAELIRQFKIPPDEITGKFKDWRSDVNNLPDAKNLDLIGEYQTFLNKLITQDLVRHEDRFNNFLRETITNKVSAFRMFFENWAEEIKKNIKDLNYSLQEIDFSTSPTTYIQLIAPQKLSDEATEFRNLLSKAIPNIREVDATIDGRKNHFENHIIPLIDKLKDESWRKKVMEVRSWFTYKAKEFYKETNSERNTYESMGQLSGGKKAQLTYTILGSAIAYQFGLTKDSLQSNSFRFIAIDEAFKAQDEEKARYLISLCKQLHLQLLVVTPSDNIHIVENDISFVHYVEKNEAEESTLIDMPIQQFKEEREKFINK
ncbi:ATP-binding protein [Bacteroidia bacterium]|nr:ATP-binding protein [Bacteroidia bacterium]